MGKRALQKRRAVGPDDWVMGTPPRRGGQDKHKTPPVQILRRGVAPPSSPSSGGASPVRKRGGSHSGSPYSSPIHRTHPHSSTATHPHIPTHTHLHSHPNTHSCARSEDSHPNTHSCRLACPVQKTVPPSGSETSPRTTGITPKMKRMSLKDVLDGYSLPHLPKSLTYAVSVSVPTAIATSHMCYCILPADCSSVCL